MYDLHGLFALPAQRLLSSAHNAYNIARLVETLPLRPRVSIATRGSAPAVHGARFDAFRVAGMSFNFVSARRWVCDLRISEALRGTIDNRVGFQSGSLGNVGGSVLDAFYRDFSGFALVSILNTFSSPYAIVRRVWPVIIKPFYGIISRPIPHVRSKGVKIIPSFAYGYTSSTVIRIIRRIRSKAPVAHIDPSSVKRVGIFKGHNFLLTNGLQPTHQGVN